MRLSSKALYINPVHWAQMRADVESKVPEEACGIIPGVADSTRLVIPVTNILHSITRFRMDPEEELDAFLLVDRENLDILAIYHSHPLGRNAPSVTDVDELAFPGITYLIWYEEAGLWRCRGYSMETTGITGEVKLVISEE